MENYPKISDAEWQVMDALWSKSPLIASEIIDLLLENNNWSPKTIHTLISRLVKKGAVKAVKEGSYYEYSPLVSQDELRNFETKSFIEKIYKGSVKLMLSNFLKEENLTEEEIEDLEKLLKKKSE